MSTWMKLLELELSSMDKGEIIEPPAEMEQGDRAVGEMSDAVRRLYTLGRMLRKNASQLALDCHYCSDKTKRVELEARTSELTAKAQAIIDIMWIAIKDELSLWGENVGIRIGFKVVTSSESPNGMPPFLRRLLGGEL